MKQIFLKSATIILFLSLIIVYIAFRSGYFGGKKSTVPVSPNGSALNNQTPYIKDSNYVKRKMDSATFAIISSKSMNISPEISYFIKSMNVFPETNDLINSMNKPYVVSELIKSLGSFDYKPVSLNRDSINLINKTNTVKVEYNWIDSLLLKPYKRDFNLPIGTTKVNTSSSKLSSSKSLIMSSEIIEVLKKDTTDKDSIIKK